MKYILVGIISGLTPLFGEAYYAALFTISKVARYLAFALIVVATCVYWFY